MLGFKGKGRGERFEDVSNGVPYASNAGSMGYSPSAYAAMNRTPYHTQNLRASDLTVGDYANGVPNIKLGEMFRSLMRQLLWVIPLFFVGGIVAFILTKDFKRTYTGEGTIMVQLGDEYVYQPIAGTQSQPSLTQTPDTITLNEVAVIKNAEVMDRVIAQIASGPGGLASLDESIAAKMNRHAPGSTAYKLAYMEMRTKMDKSFSVAARPKSSIIDVAFKHEDPQMAVSTLNALMDAYMSYRRTIFVEGAGEVITQRRKETEEQLKANDKRMASFLAGNNISNFESEQSGASKRTEDLRANLNTVRAQIASTERQLASVEDQLRNTSDTINLYIDDRASNRIAQAELELKQLLAKYLPNSDPVRLKQLELDELRSLQHSANGQVTGGRRVGPNPEYQALLRARNTAQASADSLREQEATLQSQLNSADRKVRRMTALAPGYNDILRERTTLDNRLKTYLNKEQEALINQEQSESSSENVKIISAAAYPRKGRNIRMFAWAGAWAGWGFTLFMLALFRVFIDPRLYAVPEVQMTRTGGAYPVEPQAYEPQRYRESQVYHNPIPESIQPSNFQPSYQPQEYQPEEFQAPVHEDYSGQAQPHAAPYMSETQAEQFTRPTADGTVPVPLPNAASDGRGTRSDNPYL